VLFDHALTLAESGRHQAALLMATRALQTGGEGFPSTWLLLSLLLSAQQRPGDSTEMCRIGIKTVPFPANTELHRLLGALHKARGDFAGAVDTFKGLLQLVQSQDPGQAEKNVSTNSHSRLFSWGLLSPGLRHREKTPSFPQVVLLALASCLWLPA